MANELVIFIYYIMWGMLVITSICFLLSGIDDLFFDIYYWSYFIWRIKGVDKAKRITYSKLSAKPEKRIAVMIPCWHEAGVIEQMLKYNVYAIDYESYDLFVGVYPNDPTTIQSVTYMSQLLEHVQCVINPNPGPTNKAQNLNAIYLHVLEYEKKMNIRYDIFVLHDSEDIIHALSFKLYNYLMPRNAMIQVPIFPLEVSLRYFTHWTYNAEFCEIHTKDIIVREKIGGLVPSAGVGTGFTRETLELLKQTRGGITPFSINTLTEDYSTALQIRLHGLRQIFASQYVYRTQFRKKYFFFGRPVPKKVKEFIATRALFPMTYIKAVRQKTRWILGISFQEWMNTGWKGNIATLYTLLHDRKSIFTHIITGLFFLLIPFWTLYSVFTAHSPDYPTLQDRFENSPWVWDIIIITSFLMLGRIIQRIIATTRVYGIIPGLFTVPLIFYSNVINLHALLRAYYQFMFEPKAAKSKGGGAGPKWDKTDHEFPAQRLLYAYKRKLGDLLLENRLVTKEQLLLSLDAQNKSGKQLGQIMLEEGFIDKGELTELVAKQYGLSVVPASQVIPLPKAALKYISRYHYDLLIEANCIPIRIDTDTVTVTIDNPTNELKVAKAINWLRPYRSHFILLDTSR